VRRSRRVDSPERELALALGALRIAVGGALIATPTGLRFLGLDRGPGPRALARLAGNRDIALGALAVAATHDRRLLRRVTLVNACVDAGDAVTFAIPLARRQGLDRAALLGVTSALGASLSGRWLAGRCKRA